MEIVLKRPDGNSTIVIPDGKWMASAGPASTWSAHPEDNRVPAKERPCNLLHQITYQVMGVDRSDVTVHLVEDIRPDYRSSITQNLTLVADRPFIVLGSNGYRTEQASPPVPFFVPSRQVHKGELGRLPIISAKLPKLLKWGEQSWVNLTDLCWLVQRNFVWLVQRFAAFSPSTYYEPNVPILIGKPRDREVVRVYPGPIVPESPCGGEALWSEEAMSLGELTESTTEGEELLVPKGWAATVLRLLQFGYRPDEAPTTTPSFQLEAPIPEQPVRSLPIVPVEEMRTFRLRRRREATEKEYINAVEAAVGMEDNDTWTGRPELSDPLDGFASRTKFRVIELFDGRLQISLCRWTRAGARKSDNYWMGEISVHPTRPANPRTDSATTYRLTIWPDQLQRVLPEGSVGGICPPSLDHQMGKIIWNIVNKLGYHA